MGAAPAVGDPLRFSTIAHGQRQILGPITPERSDALVERCRLHVGDHVLEVGCGKGDLLVRLLARWTSATGEGFDRNPWFLAAARAAAQAARNDVVRRVSFIETDLPAALIADRGVALTIGMGATGVYDGDQAATVRGLAAATRPGGVVVFGDGLWVREPLLSGLAAFGMAHDELAEGVDGFAALGLEAGLEVIDIEVVSEAEWDEYEASYAGAVRAWATVHPDDPDRDAFLARSAMMADSYALWRRDAFGFAIGRFRVPG